jgi:ferrous iron transport protein A
MAVLFTLADLTKGLTARIVAFRTTDRDLEIKLREIGFAEDSEVELLGRGPLGGTPLSVRLNRTLIALRPEEARAIEIESLR